MTISCQPMDATAGLPAYSAQNERQNLSPLYGGGGGVVLEARSGWRVGTAPNVLTATSTTWTLGPSSAVVSPGFATAQGSYRWSTDQNVTGSMTAADATYTHIDIVYIQVSDSSSGDGSGALTAPVLYLAGAPTASPVAPSLPPRSFLVGTITVPKVGAGSPTVVLNPAVFVAAGAPQPVFSKAERDALVPYAGLSVVRMDLPGVPVMVYNAGWPPEPLVNISTYGANWAATNTTNHQPRIRMHGNQCFLYGAITAASGASGGNMLTVPALYQPPTASTRFVGAVVASNGQYTELALSAGTLSSVAGYGNLSVSSGVIIPLTCSWWMD